MKINKLLSCIILISTPLWAGNVSAAIDASVGSIDLWPVPENIPANFLPCDGKNYNIKDYPVLFKVIGYMYGGSGVTFNVPNMHVFGALGHPEFESYPPGTVSHQGYTDRDIFITFWVQSNEEDFMNYGYMWKEGTPQPASPDLAPCRIATAWSPAKWGPITTGGIIPKGYNYIISCSTNKVRQDIGMQRWIVPFQSTKTDNTLNNKKPSVVYIIKYQ